MKPKVESKLRALLECLEPLGGEVMEMKIGSDRVVRLQIQETA